MIDFNKKYENELIDAGADRFYATVAILMEFVLLSSTPAGPNFRKICAGRLSCYKSKTAASVCISCMIDFEQLKYQPAPYTARQNDRL